MNNILSQKSKGPSFTPFGCSGCVTHGPIHITGMHPCLGFIVHRCNKHTVERKAEFKEKDAVQFEENSHIYCVLLI